LSPQCQSLELRRAARRWDKPRHFPAERNQLSYVLYKIILQHTINTIPHPRNAFYYPELLTYPTVFIELSFYPKSPNDYCCSAKTPLYFCHITNTLRVTARIVFVGANSTGLASQVIRNRSPATSWNDIGSRPQGQAPASSTNKSAIPFHPSNPLR
jgi:hypothetical protein